LYISGRVDFEHIIPFVGKSGPFNISSISSIEAFGLSILYMTVSITSPRLWGNIFAIIPTAIPYVPFINKDGILTGKTTGSFNVLSKFFFIGTILYFKSSKNKLLILDNLASVYLIAAALSPSIEPKLPCPSIKG